MKEINTRNLILRTIVEYSFGIFVIYSIMEIENDNVRSILALIISMPLIIYLLLRLHTWKKWWRERRNFSIKKKTEYTPMIPGGKLILAALPILLWFSFLFKSPFDLVQVGTLTAFCSSIVYFIFRGELKSYKINKNGIKIKWKLQNKKRNIPFFELESVNVFVLGDEGRKKLSANRYYLIAFTYKKGEPDGVMFDAGTQSYDFYPFLYTLTDYIDKKKFSIDWKKFNHYELEDLEQIRKALS